MYYNPETERAIRNIDLMAAENRRAIKNAVPVVAKLPKVWSSAEGRWVVNPDYN